MVLKQIITRNIQNHQEVIIDLPPTGFIVFMGDNSNGKSVIVRVTRDLLCNNIKKPQTRHDLVNKRASFGEAIYVRDDDTILTLHLAREAATTYVSLQYPGEQPTYRYLADKSYMELVRTFGWDADDGTDISINIAESDDALFFFKTPNKTNGKKLQAITTDARADATLESLVKTLKEARSYKDNAVANARVLHSAIDKLNIQDTQAMEKQRDTLSHYYRNLSAVYLPNLPVVKPVPNVRFVSLYRPELPNIRYPKIYSSVCNLPDLSNLLSEMRALRDKKCPMCGRGFDCGC